MASRIPVVTRNVGRAADKPRGGRAAAPGCSRALLAAILLLLAALPPASAQLSDATITSLMAQAHVPGLATAVVRDGRTVFTGAWGWANLDEQVPATPDTVFMLASVAKTVTAAALLQGVEDGEIGLHQEIAPLLPFQLMNPDFPDDGMTVHQLLSHTSSIRDIWEVVEPLYCEGDSPISLATYLADYLDEEGDYYDPYETYGEWRPGERFEYSNVGYTLAGYLVEIITQQSFDDYCTQRIFAPLEMEDTSWFLHGLDLTKVAVPYEWNSSAGRYEAFAHYGYPEYPSGQLRTSARQLARFLAMLSNGGARDGVRVLDAATVTLMSTPANPALDPEYGLGLARFDEPGRSLVGHSGGDYGVSTMMYFEPSTSTGVLVLANCEQFTADEEDAFAAIFDHIFDAAAEIRPLPTPRNPSARVGP